MLTVTPTAVAEVKKFLESEGITDERAGLRVRVLPGGCSGYQYSLDVEEEPAQNDRIIETNGLRVFIDPFSQQFLEGVEIDYVNTTMGSGFTFKNPNATGSCGCGSSFTV
ncbi:MAG: iron-sulfur cluster assembly accessory protein [Acidobacteriota bacterium]|nr:iron-sulfur cluster assembly accessory protein [Blastocatellia bacterium]MDW8413265.1 iron-sulfur cluster assembly accessory protein [Acidobacteriota bacterium]